jgi:hypothetical protein
MFRVWRDRRLDRLSSPHGIGEKMSEQKRPEDIFVGKSLNDWKQIGEERGWVSQTATLTRSRIDDALKEMEENTLLIDGFDEAFLGFSQRINQPILAVYSYDGLVKVCMDRDGMEWEEAVEYVDYNIVGAWVGEQTPIIVMPLADY